MKADKQTREYGQLLNYGFYLKNFNDLEEDGILICEVVSSRHDTHMIGEMFSLLCHNYQTINNNRNLKFRLIVSDFSWATIHAALKQMNTEDINQYMHKIFQIATLKKR